MEKNKTGKYLKYAIGEIILVVIGILIALQINNWNENRKNMIQENNILASLSIEISSQKKKLKRVINNDSLKTFSADTLMSISMPNNFKEISSKNFINHLFRVSDRTTFNPKHGTVEALLSSGELKLVQNEKLRILLAGLIGEFEDYGEEDRTIENFLENELGPYIRKRIPLYDQDTVFNYQNFRKGNYLISQEQISNILSDPYFNNLLGYGRFRYRVRAHEGNKLLNYYSTLAELIENETYKRYLYKVN